jgi:hypothetical protein
MSSDMICDSEMREIA